MRTEFENVDFVEIENDSGHKTFECVTKDKKLIATVAWNNEINQFIFCPSKDSKYITKALEQITFFLRQLG